jgi:hypothetical protein
MLAGRVAGSGGIAMDVQSSREKNVLESITRDYYGRELCRFGLKGMTLLSNIRIVDVVELKIILLTSCNLAQNAKGCGRELRIGEKHNQ